MNVLLVEDDDSIALVVEAVLKKEGHVVVRVGNAEAGLATATESIPDMLIADLTLPGDMDGLAMAKLLCARCPALPVVLMSGAFDEDSMKPPGLEKAALLPKPFRRAALLEALERARDVIQG